MAKTKQDYIDQGRADALANNPRKFTGNESWQAQCYSSGWIAGLAEAASETEAQCIDAPYENIGDSRVNVDGSVSTLVDNGDGTIGTYTTGCPKPDHPVMHDPYGEVPIPAPKAKYGHYRNDPLYCTAHAVAAHISDLLQQAGQDGGKRAHRLRKKATALIAKWKPVMTQDLVG